MIVNKLHQPDVACHESGVLRTKIIYILFFIYILCISSRKAKLTPGEPADNVNRSPFCFLKSCLISWISLRTCLTVKTLLQLTGVWSRGREESSSVCIRIYYNAKNRLNLLLCLWSPTVLKFVKICLGLVSQVRETSKMCGVAVTPRSLVGEHFTRKLTIVH